MTIKLNTPGLSRFSPQLPISYPLLQRCEITLDMKKQLSSFVWATLMVSSLCTVAGAKGYTTGKPGDKVAGSGGRLELVERTVLISNNGDTTADQLHFPWLYESSNGNWYMTYREGGHSVPDGDQVQTVKSSDQGKTWGPWLGLSAERNLRQFFPTRLSDDSLIFYRCRLEDLTAVAGKKMTDATSYMYRSTDEGDTWTKYAAPVTGMPSSTYTTGSGLKTLWGTGIQMSDGRLLIGIMSRDSISLVGVAQSTDNGQSFQYLASVCDDPSVGPWRREPGLALLENGDLIAVVRTGTNTSNMVLTHSTDGGRTWEKPRKLAEPGVCPQLRRLGNGTLVMSYGTRQYVHTAASWDGGQTWSDPLALYTGQGTGYTSIQALSADSYRVVYDESSFESGQPGGNRMVRMVLRATRAKNAATGKSR